MGFWSGVLGRRRGALADERADEDGSRPRRPAPTPTTAPPKRPPPTPTARPLDPSGTTAGTRSYRTPRDTPSTQRLHNPGRPGR